MIIPGFKGVIKQDHETLKTYSRDASLFEVRPQMVVFPKDADDIKALVRFTNANHALGFSLTARAAGTDMTGGPLNESIVVDTTRHLNHIISIALGRVVVEPGVYYRDLERELIKHDFLLPSYPASKNICAVGGMVANNAGGEKTLSYGKTADYVKRLKVILSDGNEYAIQPLNKRELYAKMRLHSFEGELYRGMYHCIKENEEIIRAAKPSVSKNSAGYALWDVWDGNIFDLTKLFTGSQGTLGIITEITFKVVRPKHHARLLVIFIHDFKKLANAILSVLARHPESFESYDDHTLKLGMRYLFWKFGWRFLPELWMMVARGMPKLVLIAEFTGNTDAEALDKARRAQRDMALVNMPTRITNSAADAEKYWAVRRESFNLLRTKIKGKQTAPFIDDIIVRPEFLPEFLPQLEALLKSYEQDMTYTIAGHIGDGNFHIIPLVDLNSARVRRIIPELSKKVYDLVVQFHGSITAEHNDGIIRTPYLQQMYGEKMYDVFRRVKHLFDPHNIFNPGKKVGGDFAYAMSHIRKN